MFEVLKIENEKIVSHSIVNREPRKNEIVVNNWQGTVGEPLTFYNDDYTRKSDIELMEAGLIEIPQGYEIKNGKLEEIKIKIQEPEKVEEEEELPPQFKKENGEIVPKTMEEMLADGTITQDDYNEYLVMNYKHYLDSTDWVVIKTLELQMKGEKVTHDYSDILAERERARAKINELEKQESRQNGKSRITIQNN